MYVLSDEKGHTLLYSETPPFPEQITSIMGACMQATGQPTYPLTCYYSTVSVNDLIGSYIEHASACSKIFKHRASNNITTTTQTKNLITQIYKIIILLNKKLRLFLTSVSMVQLPPDMREEYTETINDLIEKLKYADADALEIQYELLKTKYVFYTAGVRNEVKAVIDELSPQELLKVTEYFKQVLQNFFIGSQLDLPDVPEAVRLNKAVHLYIDATTQYGIVVKPYFLQALNQLTSNIDQAIFDINFHNLLTGAGQSIPFIDLSDADAFDTDCVTTIPDEDLAVVTEELKNAEIPAEYLEPLNDVETRDEYLIDPHQD